MNRSLIKNKINELKNSINLDMMEQKESVMIIAHLKDGNGEMNLTTMLAGKIESLSYAAYGAMCNDNDVYIMLTHAVEFYKDRGDILTKSEEEQLPKKGESLEDYMKRMTQHMPPEMQERAVMLAKLFSPHLK